MGGAQEPQGSRLATHPYRLSVRPARAAFLIGARSRDGFSKAIAEACTRWGGGTEPILPVRKRNGLTPWDEQILETSDVDGLVNVDADDEAAQRLANKYRLPLTPLDHIDRVGTTRFTTHPAAIPDGRAEDDPIWLADDDAPLWVATLIGRLTPEQLLDVDRGRFAVQPETQLDRVLMRHYAGETLIERTLAQVAESGATNLVATKSYVVVLGRPNDLRACVYYWNLRALRPLRFGKLSTVLLPFDQKKGMARYSVSLGEALSRPVDCVPDVFIHGYDIQYEAVLDAADQLGLVLSTEEIRSSRDHPPPAVRSPPFTFRADVDERQFVHFDRTYGVLGHGHVQLAVGPNTIVLPSPIQSHYPSRTLLYLRSSAFDGLPRRKPIAHEILAHSEWAGSDLKVATNLLPSYTLQVNLPTLAQATETTIKAATRAHGDSDKGRIAHSLSSLSSKGLLLKPGVLEGIRQLTTPRSAAGGSERRYRSRDQLNRGANDVDVLESLVNYGWAERGLAMTCTACTLKSFVPMASTEGPAECPECTSLSAYNSNQRGVEVFYRLNALVDRASSQGVIAHLYCDEQLRKHDESTYLLLGTDIEFHDGTMREVDLFGLHAGVVIAGEVKTSPAKFTEPEIRSDIELSLRLNADAHILACSQRVKRSTVELTSTLAHGAGLPLIVVDPEGVREP